MKVVVEEYNPEWALQFQQIKEELQQALKGVKYIGIEHVGSTSVPGLAAKPVIDLSIISTRADVEAAINALTSKGGYIYRGEMGIPDRHAWGNPGHFQRGISMSLWTDASPSGTNWGQGKLELCKRDWRDVDQYCQAKNDILAWVLEKAGMSSEEREQVRQLNTTASS
ncbi:hypothetical protein AYL99_02564 [Fonsecaea erecta]|uniref:GrpB domain protein n=1 Tax=Fonsecaea erecta TaxID=1367422 RepID=A0A178ZUA7_9EURO|nr:hypothetical protein AYL99_02564 [Fonsecaea erecta]OAP63337.1 hypothetical protein AYL99_02564 [Fonsecaea erecta]